MCKIYQKLPNDPFINEMDPVLKLYLYEQWLGDHRDNAELAKNHAYLVGSFHNPEAVKQLMNDNVHESSDEDLAQSMNMVRSVPVNSENEKTSMPTRKRKHRITTKE